MLKNITVLTFNEIKEIIEDIDSMVRDAKDGASGEQDASIICDYLVDDLIKLRNRFQ